jgi:hypothetical protein
LKLPPGATGNSLMQPFAFANIAVAVSHSRQTKKHMQWVDEVEAQMKEARKRCLRITDVQVREALLSAKAKSIGKSDQGSERIFHFL